MLTMYNCLIVPSYSTSCQNVAINMLPGTISVFFGGGITWILVLDIRFKQFFMITSFLNVLFLLFFAICLSGWFGIFSLHNTLDCGCLWGDSGNKRAFWAFQPRRRMDGEGLVIHTVNVSNRPLSNMTPPSKKSACPALGHITGRFLVCDSRFHFKAWWQSRKI